MEQKKLTGYPSIDKPWLKYYSEEAINAKFPECTLYEYLYENNKAHLNDIALFYYNRKISYGQLFRHIAETAKAYRHAGVCEGDIVSLCTVSTPETVYSLYALNQLGAVANMIDPRTGADGVIQYLNETNAKLLVTISAAVPKIERVFDSTGVERVIVVSPSDAMPFCIRAGYRATIGREEPHILQDNRYTSWETFMKAAVNDAAVAPKPYKKDTPAVIVHTGGTTGGSKGCDSYQ